MSDEVAELFDRHGPLVYRRALQILGSAADAEEATQEVFIRAARALPQFDPRAQRSTWLYRITTNYCLNRLRDERRQRALLAERADEVAPASVLYDQEKMVLMRRLLADADPREAKAALAVFVDGMSHAEAAEVLGVSRRTVGNLCERFTVWARAQLEASN